METVHFAVQTKMEKEDYRKFLYLATFFREKFTLPMVFGFAALGAAGIQLSEGAFAPLRFILLTVFLFAAAIGVLCLRVERQNKRRVASDKTGTFGGVVTLRFGDEEIEVENAALHSTGKPRYDEIYELLETADYFIFYFTATQASLLRKKDVEDPEALKAFLKEKFAKKYKVLGKLK